MSRKKRPCGKPGAMSPERQRDRERRALDERDAPASPRKRRARRRCPRLRHAERTLLRELASAAVRKLGCDEDRRDRAAVVRGSAHPATAASSSSSHSLADGLIERGHDVTLFASGGSQTKATLVSPLVEPPDPALLGNAVVRRVPRARPSYLAIGDEFDVVHDHSGIVGSAMGALLRGSPPVVHTLHGPWTEVTRRYYALLHEHVHLVAISESQTRRQSRRALRRGGAQRHRPFRLPVPRRQGRLPRLHRSRQSRQGSIHRHRGRPTRRPAARHGRQEERTVRARLLGRDRRTAAERRGRGVRGDLP